MTTYGSTTTVRPHSKPLDPTSLAPFPNLKITNIKLGNKQCDYVTVCYRVTLKLHSKNMT